MRVESNTDVRSGNSMIPGEGRSSTNGETPAKSMLGELADSAVKAGECPQIPSSSQPPRSPETAALGLKFQAGAGSNPLRGLLLIP